MNEKRQVTDTDEELIDILTAISVVSKRLARNLTILAAQSKSKEGGFVRRACRGDSLCR